MFEHPSTPPQCLPAQLNHRLCPDQLALLCRVVLWVQPVDHLHAPSRVGCHVELAAASVAPIYRKADVLLLSLLQRRAQQQPSTAPKPLHPQG